MTQFLLAIVLLFATAPALRAQDGAVMPTPDAETSSAHIQVAQAQPERRAARPGYAEMKDKYNKWTVGLAAGLYEGAGTRMAAE